MNYLEHKTEVKFKDALLECAQEWQWFIDIIEVEYNIERINSWNEYVAKSAYQETVLKYFVNILEVCKKDWSFSKKMFEEIWIVAQYYTGILNEDDCIDKIQSDQCKILFLCVWVTKIENSCNETHYLIDSRLLNWRNCFELIHCDLLQVQEEKIFGYAKTISITGLDVPLQCLRDNIHQIYYPSDESFLLKHKNEILNYNAFSFQRLSRKEICRTWQERYLLDMLWVSFNKEEKKIQPVIELNDNVTPDTSLWTQDVLNSVKKYFDNEISDFVVETILYIKWNVEPSKEVKLLHCDQLLNAINTQDRNFELLSCSSYYVLSFLQNDKLLQDCSEEERFIKLVHMLQKVEAPLDIMRLKEDGYPVNKPQKEILNEFLQNKYKEIDHVSSIEELLSYLEDDLTTKQITTEYLERVNEKFEIYAVGSELRTALAYYDFMIFLINVKGKSQNVDKTYTQKLMIQIQEKWQGSVYEEQLKNTHEFSYEQKVETTQIEETSYLWLINPIIFAHTCIPCSEKEVLSVIEKSSEAPFRILCTSISLNPIFPEKDIIFDIEKHEIDKILVNYIDALKHQYGYRLLNNIDANVFAREIHSVSKFNTQINIALFSKEEELYNSVRSQSPVELLDYSSHISLAYVSQLFPLLELKVRDLVKLFGIFPFKEKSKQFMQHNDPSSLLRELLKILYDKFNSFENVPDLLFVYNIMYNSNSCNIRNECIHGRNYFYGGKLRFAFRSTLFAIHMLDFRLNTIKDNVSDIIDEC